MALEDGNFENAHKFFEDALNLDAECAEAYLGLAMCKKAVCTLEALVSWHDWNDSDYRRGKQFASSELASRLVLLEGKQQAQRSLQQTRNLASLKDCFARNQKVASRIAVGAYHTVAVRTDGTAVATVFTGQYKNDYGQCKVEKWSNLIAVSAGEYHTVGLRADGTVVATGDNSYGQCMTNGWRDIVAISAGDTHTVGLKSDGTVVATAYIGVAQKNFGQCKVEHWRGITAIYARAHHTLGLKSDGTVVATGSRAEKLKNWKNIVALSSNGLHTVGLRSDGTVVAEGTNSEGQCDVSNWQNIVGISAAMRYTLGLKSDGKVTATIYKGNTSQYYGERSVQHWTDVVAVVTRTFHSVAVKADGTVMAIGNNTSGQCNVSGWKLFENVNNLE
jgi:alpha-tubulin suppressor-like RCC1 family protein